MIWKRCIHKGVFMKTLLEQIKLITTIFKTSHRFDPKITLYEILHGLCVNGKIIITIIVPAHLVNLLTDGRQWNRILATGVLYGISISLLSCGEKSFKLLQEAHGFRACNLFRLSMNQKFMKLDYADTENSKVLDAFEQAKDSMWEFTDVGYVIFDDILGNLITFATMTYILANINGWIYVIVLFFICLVVWIQHKKNKAVHDGELKEKVIKRVLDYTGRLMQDYSVGKETRIYNLDQFFYEKYCLQAKKYKEAVKEKEHRIFWLTAGQTLIHFVQLILIYITAWKQYIRGILPIGSFLLYITAIQGLSKSVENLFSAGIELSRVSLYYKDFLEYMKLPEKLRTSGEQQVKEEALIFEVKNLSYRYPNSEKYAVENVTFSFSEGDKIALVGENGSGKSTMIKLLLRLYDPTEGAIYLNGVDIRNYRYEEYLKIFSCVFQDFSIFAYSILENIVFDQEMNMERLTQILDMVGLSEKLLRYPHGIDSLVTKTLSDDGVQLSGGEQQLVVIGRAFYQNRSAAIFDEPTAALDPLKEAAIYDLIYKLAEKKTTFFCSHRMSSTRFCNEILVFEGGRLVEKGGHERLMKLRDVYYRMYSNQAALYHDKK